MKLYSLLTLLVLLGMPLAVSAADPAAPTIILPDQLKWMPAPIQGAEMALLMGDPSKPGPFAIRLRFPDGFKVAPHFHGDTERVTVISGTFLVGIGDKMVESSMMALPPGSFVTIPAGVHHYAMARGQTIVQLGGTGPFGMTVVK